MRRSITTGGVSDSRRDSEGKFLPHQEILIENVQSCTRSPSSSSMIAFDVNVHVTGKVQANKRQRKQALARKRTQLGLVAIECHLLPQRSRVPRLLAVPHLYLPILILPTSLRALQLALQSILVFLPRSTLHGVRPLRVQHLHRPAKMP